MNGMKIPEFLKNKDLPPEYYAPVNPYKDPAPSPINIRKLYHYAENKGKQIIDLTEDELKESEAIL